MNILITFFAFVDFVPVIILGLFGLYLIIKLICGYFRKFNLSKFENIMLDFSKIFAIMSLIMIIPVFIFHIITQFVKIDGFTPNISGSIFNIVILFLIFIMFSTAMLRIASNLQKDKESSSNWLITIWLFMILSTQYHFSLELVDIAQIVICVLGLTTIAALLYKEYPALTTNNKILKNIRSGLLVFVLLLGFWLWPYKYTVTGNFCSTYQTNSYSQRNIVPKVDTIFFIAGTPDKESYDLAQELAKMVNIELKAKTQAVKFNELIVKTDFNHNLYFLVSYGKVEKQKMPELGLNLPPELKGKIKLDIKSLNPTFNQNVGKRGFEIRLLGTNIKKQKQYNTLVIPSLDMLSYTATVIVNISSKSAMIKNVAQQIKPNLLLVLAPACSPSAFDLPAIPEEHPAKPMLSFPKLIDSRVLLCTEDFEIHQFKKSNFDDEMIAISEVLTPLGIEKDNNSYGDNAVCFRDKNYDTHVLIHLSKDPNGQASFFDNNFTIPYGTILVTKRVPQKKTDNTKEFIEKLRKNNVKALLLSSGLRKLNDDDKIAALNDFMKLDNLTLAQKVHMLQANNLHKPVPKVFEVYKQIFESVIDELMQKPNSDNFLSEISNLFSTAQNSPELEAILIKKLGKHYEEFTLDAANNFKIEKELTLNELLTQKIIKIKVENYNAVTSSFGLCKLENNTYKVSLGNSTHSGISYKEINFYTSSGSSHLDDKKQIWLNTRGTMSNVLYEWNDSELTVSVAWNSKKQKFDFLIVSKLPQ